ncbi:hypothetical protein, partial [Phytoactinopolyspora halophila]|uniref:hypothetical protein n=1 Tax=Phytoactinopolyspora halophila TaxID=1981511 RepID=UPI0011BDC0BB
MRAKVMKRRALTSLAGLGSVALLGATVAAPASAQNPLPEVMQDVTLEVTADASVEGEPGDVVE